MNNFNVDKSQSLYSLLSRKQTADLLGVSTRTLRRMERRGELDPIRISSRLVRYSASQIRELLTRG
ncbi:MAG TPA: helix-turn-helix domain-containing protein [Verrucomicrobiota bacterium]|jgi:predicted DNA-binding transcriptional regulator AlpA|nr:helix-turn-helix domain-containing protein [Verrucomicrobiota bacterium]HQB17563.1 helix-turn-helix domain-containing protein [Verrucomicrobiota bacterium]